MDFDKEFSSPFGKDGTPKDYLRLIVPLIDKVVTDKAEMLGMMGINLRFNPEKRNSHSTMLAKLSRLEILETRERGDGTWRRGKNWNLFMGWLTMHILQNKNLRGKFKNMLYKMETNSLDFIMKD